jgi:sugar transferase (PEP-CTERM system associated)
MPAWTIKNFIRTPLLILGLIEALIAYSSVYVAAFLLPGDLEELPTSPDNLPLRAAIVTVVIVTSLIAMGLYHLQQRSYFREVAVRVLVALLGAAAAMAMLFYAFPSIMLSREMAMVSMLYMLPLLLLVRLLFLKHVDDNVFRYKTLIYGAGERAQAISDLRRRADRRGFKVVGQIVAAGDKVVEGCDAVQLGSRSICSFAAECGADEIVVAMDDRRGNLLIRELLDCRLQGIEVIDLLEFLERETGKIRVDLVNPGWLIFGPGFRMTGLRRFNKRAVDVMSSAALLFLTWPIVLVVALAIKLSDGIDAPLLYRQRRVGRNNKEFDVLKFRSMRVDAETDGAQWAEENDPRVTRIGAFLRKYRLDELPQIFNVLRGQMSLVGPRPERPEFVNCLKETIPYYAERHVVNPGVTGWAQLRYAYGANEEDALEKLQYDLYYVKNQGLILDLMIILQTVEIVLWGKGAR